MNVYLYFLCFVEYEILCLSDLLYLCVFACDCVCGSVFLYSFMCMCVCEYPGVFECLCVSA